MTAKLQELLRKGDVELFSAGGCHAYALAMKTRFPSVKIKHAGGASALGSARALHVYTVIDDFKIDVLGVENEEQYLRANGYASWEVAEETLTAPDPTNVSENGPLNQWRHYLDPEFLSSAMSRAHINIERATLPDEVRAKLAASDDR
jgi:hypothetical protein